MSKYSEGVEVQPLSRDDIRRMTKALRKRLKLDDYAPFPVMVFFEMILPMIFEDFTYEIKPRAKMGNKHGETYPCSHRIVLREDVYIGACAGKGRDLYTVAHEIGHLFLHGEQYSFARRDSSNIPLFKNSEWQADAFAGELLMPFQAIKNMLASQVVETFGVTPTAARTQLRAISL